MRNIAYTILFLLGAFFSYAQSVQNITEVLEKFDEAIQKQNHDDVIALGIILINHVEKEKYAFDTTIAQIRIYTALSFEDRGDFLSALEWNEKTKKLISENWSSSHNYYQTLLNNIASNYSNIGNYSKALEYNLQALKIRETTLGKEHPDYLQSLTNTAVNYMDLGHYLKALEYNLKALKIREKTLGKTHPEYVVSLTSIALIYSYMGEYYKAQKYHLQAQEIIKNTFGKEHPYYATSINNIALNYSNLGDYPEALKYYTEVLELWKKILGEDHPDYAKILNNTAIIYGKTGDYSRALEYSFQALKIRENTLGKAHSDYAISLTTMAWIYDITGDYSKALEFDLEALRIIENTLGKDHIQYAKLLNNTAVNYSKLGDYSKALDYNLQAHKIIKNSLGKEHPDYGRSFEHIASYYTNKGDYSRALEYELRALKVIKNSLGKEHPDYGQSLYYISRIYSENGDYLKSLEYGLEALKVIENILGKEHSDYAIILNSISSNYINLGDYSLCLEYLNESYTIQEQSFTKNKFGLDKHMQENYKKKLYHSYKLISGLLVIDTKNSQFVNKSWINLNGLLSADTKNLENQILETGDTSLVKTMESLKLSKMQLAKYNELTLKEKEQRGINQQVLEDEITAMERELSKKSQAFANFNRYFYASDVTKELDVNEFFVDIARIPYYSFYSNKWTDSIKYLVFITDSKDTLVDYLFIDNGLELEKELISDYKLESSDKNAATDLKNEIFYNSFWKPIADKIGDAKTVYVSLGGIYNNINLNTLYNPETGKYLIEEKDIRIVNSARDFVLSKEREKKPYTSTNSALYGFPDFNGNTTKTVDSTDFLASTRDLGQMWIDSLTRGGMKASPLPATKVEIEQIAGTFQKNGWSVKTYTGETASETNIKLEESPRVLHVATHGYFFEDIPMDKSNDRFLGMDRQRVVQDPMLRSGLLFTGANKTLQGEQVNGENGLLSAAEASLLDLRETELVVLSACETGKGEVKNSEGVYGLRKAFTDAGAQNIIMSLWKVDDKVTQEFMSRFYEIWLNEKTTIRDAFNRTQLEIKAKYPQPYYWGAFILVGE